MGYHPGGLGVGHTPRALKHTALWLCLLLCLAGCSANLRPAPPLTDLTLPKVTQITGITGLHTQPGQGIIRAVGTYKSVTGTRTDKVLFALDGSLYEVGVDGSGLRSLGVACDGAAVTPDGQWATCWGDSGVVLIPLATPVSGERSLALQDSSWLGDLAWLANGRYLTMSTYYDEKQCSILIYAVAPSADAFRLVGVMSFPQFVSRAYGGRDCELFNQAWSPDGAWLAFAAQINNAPAYVYAYPTAALLADLDQATSVVHITVPLSALISLSEYVAVSPQSWIERDGHAILTFAHAQTIIEVDPSTGQRMNVLTFTDGKLGPLAWTPDGQHLVFTQERGSCFPDCPPSFTPSHLYVYTP